MSPAGTELSLEECALWTVREALSSLSRAQNKNMPNATIFFFFDFAENVAQIAA